MPPIPTIGSPRQLDHLLLASGGRFRRYRWIVFAAAVAIEVAVICLVHQTGATFYPLDPVGAGVVFVSVLAAGLAGAVVGLLAAVAGVAVSFVVLADFGTSTGIANAIISAFVWCGASAATGLVVSYLRRQVARRETALGLALNRSLSAREQIERVMDFSPQFYQSKNLNEAAVAICEAAVDTFGADGARVYIIKDSVMEILAITPVSKSIVPGFTVPLAEFPDTEEILAGRRPYFVRDTRQTPAGGPALELRGELRIVSGIRTPIASTTGPVGLLSLGWTHAIERPTEDFMAIIQRFTDQAAIAWHSALQAEAQRQASELHETLDRLCALAPSFQITGTQEQVAQAICEAALSTFGCTGAALFRVESDRLRVLDRRPPVQALGTGRVFPFTAGTLPIHELLTHSPTFIPDISDPGYPLPPWLSGLIQQGSARSVLCVPTRLGEHESQSLLVLSWDRPGEEPDPGFLVIVERFADQAAMALANAAVDRLHARLEASLLPSTPIDHPRLTVTTRYRTGEQRLRLGGDFVGSTSAEDTKLHFIIGDISGHGPDAAALGATLRSTWKALVLAGIPLPEIVKIMQTVLLAEKAEPVVLATIIAGFIDLEQQVVSFINAGHLPPLLIADGMVSSLDTKPVAPLGFDSGISRSSSRFPLPPRWSLFLYTDGLIEARVAPGSSERYGEHRLMERLESWTSATPNDKAVDALMSEIETAGGSHFGDDVAILLISTRDPDGTPGA